MATIARVDQSTIRRRGVGLRAIDRSRVQPGYTLFTPLAGDAGTFLIDLDGNVVHEWHVPDAEGFYAHLLPNGNLYWQGRTDEPVERFPMWSLFKGGLIRELDWDGNVVWEYRHPDQHHDARRLRNGNNILLALDPIPNEVAARVVGGRPRTEAPGGRMYSDALYEVTPGGEISWEWHAWQHLDPAVDLITAQDERTEWTHANTVSELADDNLLVSFRNISLVAIVDRASGELVWRLGHEVLGQQHDPQELPNGNILIFDNGAHRVDAALNFSRVIEVDRRTHEIVWEYRDDPPHAFFSAYISGAQRLPNGNTLITEGAYGRIFEVTPEGETVWEYVSPYFGSWSRIDTSLVGRGQQNPVYRAFRYTPDELPVALAAR
jgi:hypothetical protein